MSDLIHPVEYRTRGVTSSDSELGNAVMEAFRALRADDAVQTLPARSAARKARISNILAPIAANYGMGMQDLATALAKAMSRS